MGRRSKDLLLLVLAVTALVVALYTFRGKPTPRAPAPQAGTQVAQAPEASTTPGPEPSSEEPATGSEEEQGTEAAGQTRNPFVEPGSAEAAMVRPAETGGETEPKEPEARPGEREAEPSLGKLSLTGIVAGNPTVALIRENDQRYFVKVGDPLGDRYRVQSIGTHHVVLVGGQGKVTLRMGGRQ